MEYRLLGPLRPKGLGDHHGHHDLRPGQGQPRRVDRPRRGEAADRRSASTPGVNLIDTADVYPAGVSEEIVGQALGKKRGDVLARHQGALPDGPTGPTTAGTVAPPPHRRLRGQPASGCGTDWIDLYQVHRVGRPDAARGDAGGPRHARHIRQGPLHRLLQLLRLAHHEGPSASPTGRAYQRFVSQQIHYSLQAREAEYELVPISLDRGARHPGVEPARRRPAQRQVPPRPGRTPEGSRQLAGWNEPPIRDEEALYDIVEVLVEIADARGVSGAQVALAWLLGRPGVTSVIIGGRTEKQFTDNLAAADLVLSAEERQRLDKVSALPLLYPTGISRWLPRTGSRPPTLPLLSPCLADLESSAAPGRSGMPQSAKARAH